MTHNQPIYLHFNECPPKGVTDSHWWGEPAMPPEYALPMRYNPMTDNMSPMTFLCQINLAELPANDKLPGAGLLLFFADIDYYTGDYDAEQKITMCIEDSTPEAVKVIFVPGSELGRVVLRTGCAMAAPQSLSFDHIRPTVEEPDIQMFGRTDHLEWEDWPEPCEGWELLLQMDSMEGRGFEINFVDWGVLCFLIAPKALKECDFSEVQPLILST